MFDKYGLSVCFLTMPIQQINLTEGKNYTFAYC